MNDSLPTMPDTRPGPVWLPPWIYEERFWLGALTVVVALFGLLYIRFEFLVGLNHDEVEHAHAAFRILGGELPYRDFYQNHWPAHWLLVTQFVGAFPFSIKAIIAGRVISLLALLGCGWLGLRLLAQIPGGLSRLSILVYIAAVVALGFVFEIYYTRPDILMTLFTTAGLCLIPARGKLRNIRALGLGLIFGMACSMSSKMMPMLLVIPLLLVYHAVNAGSFRPLMALFPYAAGISLALAPSIFWLWHHGLLSAFYFDVFALNMAVSKPWVQSARILDVTLFLPAVLGVLAWAWARWAAPKDDKNGFLVVVLALVCGMLLTLITRHPSLYNLQVLAIPLAVGFTSLTSFLWLNGRDLGNRLLITAALLAYPLSYTSVEMALIGGSPRLQLSELQGIMNLAKPGNRTCIAFSPIHPVFCNSISQLSNGWDLWFTKRVTDPRQSERFHRIWQEGIDRTLEIKPDIILRRSSNNFWEDAVTSGLIGQEDLDALDRLQPEYEIRNIGDNEFWLRKPER